MTEKGREKVKKRTGKLLNSFVVLTIVLSVLAASVTSVSAEDFDDIIVTADPSTILADGASTSTITATLIKDGIPVTEQGVAVIFDFVGDNKGAELNTSAPVLKYTNETGKANTTLTAGTETGVVTIEAKTVGSPANPSRSNTTQVTLSGPPEVTSIVVSPPEKTLIVGETQQFTATAYDQYSDEVPDVEFTWESSDGTVGTVNETGFFEALALGSTFVNATNASIVGSASVTVTVYAPDLIVTEITPNCDEIFGNESNEVCAVIKNVGPADASAFNVSFVIDSFREEVRVSGLAPGANTTQCVNDSTLRNAGDLVSINVTADCNGEISELNETNNWMNISMTVMNNGYKSKSFAGLPSLVLHEYGKFNGSIVYTVGNSSKVELEPANTTTTGFDITIPGGATVRAARLYVYWYDSWYSAVHGDADLEVTFDGHSFTTPGASYTDRKGFGSYNYPKGTYAYDVTCDVSGTGTYTAAIENTAANTNTVLTGQLLLVVYEDTNESEMEYWITEGCDLLKADSNYCVSPEEAIANVTFEGTIDVTNKSARLITVVAQGNELGTDLSFNDKIWEDVWQVPAGNSKIDIDDRSVTSWLNPSDNVADFRDTGTMGMQASNAILVVEHVVEYNFTIDFVTGYNMISMPLNDTSVTNASTLIDKIGANCTEIFKWNTTTQGWESYNPSTPPAAAFNIVGGEGYFVSMSGPKTVVFRGKGWESPFSMSLVTGYNMIGIPVNDTSVTNASLLLAKIGANCTEIFKWNTTTQGWESYNPSMPPAAAFNIGCGEGYFVSMVGPADVTFVGEPCQD